MVKVSNLSPVQKRALRITDNRVAETSSWDDDLLKGEFQFLLGQDFELELTGFDAIDLDRILTPDGISDADANETLPAPPSRPVSRLGDVWTLGPHRLICGDARDSETFRILMQGEVADVVVTNPPTTYRSPAM